MPTGYFSRLLVFALFVHNNYAELDPSDPTDFIRSHIDIL